MRHSARRAARNSAAGLINVLALAVSVPAVHRRPT